MNKPILKNTLYIKGVSLIEMCFFISSFGIMIAAGAPIYTLYENHKRLDVTNANLIQAQKALDKYFLMHNLLPCAAPRNVAVDAAGYGQEDTTNPCRLDSASSPQAELGDGTARAAPGLNPQINPMPIRIGALPVRELGLPDSVDSDGWGHRLIYAVTESYAGVGASPPSDMSSGVITINDSSGKPATNVPANVVYAVIAPGADPRGAYNSNGVLVQPCATGLPAGQNCSDTGIFIATTLISNAAANTFTNLVVYRGSGTGCTTILSMSNCTAGGDPRVHFYNLANYNQGHTSPLSMSFLTPKDRIKHLQLYLSNGTLNIPDQLFTEGFPGEPTLTEWFGACVDATFTPAENGTYSFASSADDGVAVYINGNQTWSGGVASGTPGTLVMANLTDQGRDSPAHDYGQLDPQQPTTPEVPSVEQAGVRLPGPLNSFFAESTPSTISLNAGQTYTVMIEFAQAWPHLMAAQVFAFSPSEQTAGRVPSLAPGTLATLRDDLQQVPDPTTGNPGSPIMNYIMQLGGPGASYQCPH